MAARRVGVLTGGGDSSGIHAFLWRLHRRLEPLDATLLGFRDGWEGVVAGQYEELHQESLRPVAFSAGTILGTSRNNPLKEKTLHQAADRLAEAGVECLVVVGGTETLATAAALVNLGVRVIGVPKTIDNDIIGSETAIGFPTAVQRGVETISSCVASNWAHGRDMVIQCMGRDTGWLALHVALDAFADALVIPEVPFDVEWLAGVVKDRVGAGQRSVLIVVSEGIHLSGSSPAVQAAGGAVDGTTAAVGYAVGSLLAEKTGREPRVQVLGYALRGGPPSERELWQANLLADRVVDLARAGRCGVMVGIQGGRIVEVPLEQVARGYRMVTQEWLALAREMGMIPAPKAT